MGARRINIGLVYFVTHDVNIHDGADHSLNHIERHKHYRRIYEKSYLRTEFGIPGVKSPSVVLEGDVWISFGVTILPGVTIGK